MGNAPSSSKKNSDPNDKNHDARAGGGNAHDDDHTGKHQVNVHFGDRSQSQSPTTINGNSGELTPLLQAAADAVLPSPPLEESGLRNRKQQQQRSLNTSVSSSYPVHQSLPLSARLIGSLAGGIYCQECRRDSNKNSSVRSAGGFQDCNSDLLHDFFGERNPSSIRDSNHLFSSNIGRTENNGDKNSEEDDDNDHHDYNLQELARVNNSAVISPLVLAPMLHQPPVGKMATMERIMTEYIATCKFYGCENRVNAGVLTTIRFSLPSLRVSGDFHDADMLALVEILLRHGNGPLRYVKRLDFSRSSKEGKLHGIAGFKSHGALALSKFLAQSQFVQELRLQGNRLGPYGASAIFLACSRNQTLKRLYMRQCLIKERGGLAFAELLSQSSNQCGLVDVDLGVNRIGFRGCLAIERALMKRQERGQDNMYVDTMGNLVLQEILNGCTHGLGIILAIVGAVLLSRRVKGMSFRHVISCAIYDASLLVLYTSSTLYHSFFALQHTRYVFEVFDKCAIYILIAGSYTPFITIAMVNHFKLMVSMLVFIWAGCFLGIYVEYAHPTWQKKQIFSLSMYLGMGWVAAFAPSDVVANVAQGAINLIVLGGVGYTAGVPFFLRDNFLDHSLWHLFVLSGSIFHWAALYFYIVLMK